METFPTLAGIFVTAFAVALSGALMPGPLLAVTVAEATKRGMRAGPLLMVGHMILEGALVAAIALGLAHFLKNSLFIGIVGLCGGGMMGGMGWSMVRSARHVSLSAQAPKSSTSSFHPILKGALASLSNPYWTIWWATIGITYVMMGLRFGAAGIITFFAGHILADFAWYTLVSAGVARGRKILSNHTYRRIVNACGFALLLFGVWFLRTGWVALFTKK